MRFLLVCLLLATACMPRPRARYYTLTTKYDEAQHGPYMAQGTATIAGQAFTTTRGGDVKHCAGRPVILIPATPFFREYVEHSMILEEIVGLPPGMDASLRRTTGDGAGNFEFAQIPAGRYFVACTITWEVPQTTYTHSAGPITVMERTGGTVVAEVVAVEGQTTKVIVSR